ncbi:MAG: cell division protein FtsB [Gammaproteobacteria bacterium]
MLAAILLGLVIALQWRVWYAPGGLQTVGTLQHAIERQRAQNAELVERNSALGAEVEDLKSGLDAVEERARSEMGMIREGEIFYQTIQAEPARGGLAALGR